MSGENYTTWLELLLEHEKTRIKANDDLLIILVHWYLVKIGFKCLDAKNKNTSTEVLPEGWNGSQPYSLAYIFNGKEYLLTTNKTENDLIINLLCLSTENVGAVLFNVARDVCDGTGVDRFNDLQRLIRSIKENLVSPFTLKSQDAGSQTPQETYTSQMGGKSEPRRDDPLMIPRPLHMPHPLSDPRAVGRADLDPFGQGGGMIFDPFSAPRRDLPHPGLGVPGGLPRGSIPPGARFDPIGPVGPDGPRRRLGPDPDHLPPPGYDDMFM